MKLSNFITCSWTSKWSKSTKKDIFLFLEENIQLTLIISKSNRLYEIIRDIRTSTYMYQICRTEEKINRIPHFTVNIVFDLRSLRYIENICGNRRNCSFVQFLLFSTTFCYLLLDFHIKTGYRFSSRDSEVKITIVDCMLWYSLEAPHCDTSIESPLPV